MVSKLPGKKKRNGYFDDTNPAPLALRQRDAAQALGISQRTLWDLTNQGVIPVMRLGSGERRMALYSIDVLKDWLKVNTARSNGDDK